MPQAAQPGAPPAKVGAADATKPSTVKELETRLALETTLRRLTNKIHSASIDEMLLSVRNDVQRLIGCERVTIYAKDPAKPEIISKVKDGNEVREIRLPVSGKSIASWVARTQRAVRIKDAYDSKELTSTHAELAFDSTWDTKSGFRTRQVLGAPIAQNGKLLGVIQVVNKRDGGGFTEDDERIVSELSETLAIAMFNQRQLAARRTRYDRLLMAGRVTDEMIEEAKTLARQQDASFEKVLMDKFKIPKAEILQSLAEYYRCEAMEPAEEIPPPLDVLEDFVIDYLKHHVVCPLQREGENVVVFMGDPKDVVDGVCQEYTKLPKKFARAVVSRIKIMSGLDIAERRLPQDGKIKFRNYGRLDIELRVAVLPTAAQQEDVVMRILAASKPIPIDNVGITLANLESFKEIVQAPYGRHRTLEVLGRARSGRGDPLCGSAGHSR